ncbi:hypothetical protein AUEXF2481DRAFT_446798 [Aureobasidium subglaciale EXF-2481]|uniref:Uncharacterized protein n=1 Tax=Aureobasidium subglaciale (strain EXF-2481) TaxID=1043005 RepID=A0A074YYC0_AURSE|nr:uncharacterized protein AUEXF2481DRAFT_446798 [Aureobasidium subglaciale EXF-2481]KEQ91871.1 hypothetical protein AUEXF2481DRAFT_446798 [Aureobasidium subglaciale EXF-2481]
MPTLTNSIRRSRLMTTKKHTLHDPRTPFPTFLDDVVWNGPQLCGNIVSFDLNAPSTPTRQCTSPLDPASIEEEEERTRKTTPSSSLTQSSSDLLLSSLPDTSLVDTPSFWYPDRTTTPSNCSFASSTPEISTATSPMLARSRVAVRHSTSSCMTTPSPSS